MILVLVLCVGIFDSGEPAVRSVERSGAADQHGAEGRLRPGVPGGGEEPVPLHHHQRVPAVGRLRQLRHGRPQVVPARGHRLPRQRREGHPQLALCQVPVRMGQGLQDVACKLASELLVRQWAIPAVPVAEDAKKTTAAI